MSTWLIVIAIVLLVLAPVGLALGGSAVLSRGLAATGEISERRIEKFASVLLGVVVLGAAAALFLLPRPRLGIAVGIAGWVAGIQLVIHIGLHWARRLRAWAVPLVMAALLVALWYAARPLVLWYAFRMASGSALQRGTEMALGWMCGSAFCVLVSEALARRRARRPS